MTTHESDLNKWMCEACGAVLAPNEQAIELHSIWHEKIRSLFSKQAALIEALGQKTGLLR